MNVVELPRRLSAQAFRQRFPCDGDEGSKSLVEAGQRHGPEVNGEIMTMGFNDPTVARWTNKREVEDPDEA